MNETLLAKDWEGKNLGAGSIAGFLSPQNHHHNPNNHIITIIFTGSTYAFKTSTTTGKITKGVERGDAFGQS